MKPPDAMPFTDAMCEGAPILDAWIETLGGPVRVAEQLGIPIEHANGLSLLSRAYSLSTFSSFARLLIEAGAVLNNCGLALLKGVEDGLQAQEEGSPTGSAEELATVRMALFASVRAASRDWN